LAIDLVYNSLLDKGTDAYFFLAAFFGLGFGLPATLILTSSSNDALLPNS